MFCPCLANSSLQFIFIFTIFHIKTIPMKICVSIQIGNYFLTVSDWISSKKKEKGAALELHDDRSTNF